MGKDQPVTPEESQKPMADSPQITIQTQKVEMVELSSGEDMKAAEARLIMDSLPTRIIVLAGAADAGKTTLLLTIMHQFHKGGFGDYVFAGSRTLLGFERRAFDSYVASGRETPTTQHTISTIDEIKFLHLAVRRKDLISPIISLLFTDISGENFRDARDSDEECRKLWVLPRADRFVLLFDGKKIADPAQRQKAKVDGLMLLRRCIETDMIGRTSKVDFLVTKRDVLETSPDSIIAFAFVDEIKREISNRFESSLGSISFHFVSARPAMKRELGETLGFEGFLPAWIEQSPFIRPIIREIPNASSENARMFSSFGSLKSEI